VAGCAGHVITSINSQENSMKSLTKTLMCMGFALAAAGSSFAQDAMKKDDAMKDGMAKKEMTMQECKDHMAMAKKADGMKKDDAMMHKDDAMKKDAACADMMKKSDGMKKEGAAADSMMKK
jgi:hypothetical protein